MAAETAADQLLLLLSAAAAVAEAELVLHGQFQAFPVRIEMKSTLSAEIMDYVWVPVMLPFCLVLAS